MLFIFNNAMTFLDLFCDFGVFDKVFYFFVIILIIIFISYYLSNFAVCLILSMYNLMIIITYLIYGT